MNKWCLIYKHYLVYHHIQHHCSASLRRSGDHDVKFSPWCAERPSRSELDWGRRNKEMSLFITCLTGMGVNTLSNRHDWLNKTCMWNCKPMSNNGKIQLWPNLNQWKVSEMRWPKSFTLDSWQRLKIATLDLTTECLPDLTERWPDLTERWPHLTDRAQIN